MLDYLESLKKPIKEDSNNSNDFEEDFEEPAVDDILVDLDSIECYSLKKHLRKSIYYDL
jgi:hypothetical protein